MWNTQSKPKNGNAIFNTLLTTAKEVKGRQHKHAAAITYRGKILSIGTNTLKTHPLMLQYRSDENKIELHAEIDAIIKVVNLYGTEYLKDCELFVLRHTRGGHIGNSKPCVGCQRAIDAFGLKKVHYTEKMTCESGIPMP